MKKYLIIILLAFAACVDDSYKEMVYTQVEIRLAKPENSPIALSEVEVVLENVATRQNTIGTLDDQGVWRVEVENGIYNVRAVVEKEDDGVVYINRFSTKNEKLTGDKYLIEGELSYIKMGGSWVIEEIYAAGSSPRYYADQYIKLYNNNSEETLYADQLMLCECYLASSVEYQVFGDSIALGAIYVVPGSGHDYPVLPGHSLLIANQAQNHRGDSLLNPNSPVDLSGADFEWYDNSLRDIDNPQVPNLDKYYCYSKSLWIMGVSLTRSLMICKLPENLSIQSYLDANQKAITRNSGKQELVYVMLPEYVLDGVELNSTDVSTHVLPVSIDAGFTHGNGSYNGTSVRRKVAQVKDGMVYLQDTNNSTADFMTNCEPSPFVIPM